MREVWKPVTDYENLYEVSNFGRVKSKGRKVLKSHNGTYQTINEKILTPSIRSKNNYYCVHLSKRGTSRMVSVHRIVAEAFLPNPEGKTQVNHLDGNKLNNRIDNLEWVTPKENKIHAVYTGLAIPNYGIKPTRCRSDGKIFQSASLAAECYGLVSTAVMKVCRGEWNHAKGLKFEYVNDAYTTKPETEGEK